LHVASLVRRGQWDDHEISLLGDLADLPADPLLWAPEHYDRAAAIMRAAADDLAWQAESARHPVRAEALGRVRRRDGLPRRWRVG
jgi:hypothetical protein